MIPSFTQLQELRIGSVAPTILFQSVVSSTWLPRNADISAGDVITIYSYLPCLTSTSILQCNNESNIGVIVAGMCNLPNLQHRLTALDLYHYRTVLVESDLRPLYLLRNLAILDLNFCRQLKQIRMLNNLPELHTLDLYGCQLDSSALINCTICKLRTLTCSDYLEMPTSFRLNQLRLYHWWGDSKCVVPIFNTNVIANLRSLTFCGIDLSSELISLISSFPNLCSLGLDSSLPLSWFEHVEEDESFEYYCHRRGASDPDAAMIVTDKGDAITFADALCSALQSCPYLESVYLCPSLTSSYIVQSILIRCPRLK